MFEYASFVMRNPSYVTKNIRKQYQVRKALLEFKKENPVCAATGNTTNLQVHHVIPVSVAPNLAGTKSNMIVLCRRAHFMDGHALNYKQYVPNVREICALRQIQKTTKYK